MRCTMVIKSDGSATIVKCDDEDCPDKKQGGLQTPVVAVGAMFRLRPVLVHATSPAPGDKQDYDIQSGQEPLSS
jgi:hypothetical protein